jgi:hypothetical protein
VQRIKYMDEGNIYEKRREEIEFARDMDILIKD